MKAEFSDRNHDRQTCKQVLNPKRKYTQRGERSEPATTDRDLDVMSSFKTRPPTVTTRANTKSTREEWTPTLFRILSDNTSIRSESQ